MRFPLIWKSPPPQLSLGENEVHLWLAAVPDCLGQLPALRALLDASEQGRADRFHFQHDRERHVVSHGILRTLLARYLGTERFTFTTNPHGKPSLQPPHDAVQFNVSHSRDLALFGFTRAGAIGVDVEWIRPDFATIEIARRFFAPDETARLEGLAPSERASGFFNCWSRKEAYIKARGFGLSLGLHTFAVTLTPGEPAALARVDGDSHAPNRWTMLDLEAGPDYRAAAAFEFRDAPVRHFHWGTDPS